MRSYYTPLMGVCSTGRRYQGTREYTRPLTLVMRSRARHERVTRFEIDILVRDFHFNHNRASNHYNDSRVLANYSTNRLQLRQCQHALPRQGSVRRTGHHGQTTLLLGAKPARPDPTVWREKRVLLCMLISLRHISLSHTTLGTTLLTVRAWTRCGSPALALCRVKVLLGLATMTWTAQMDGKIIYMELWFRVP